jgi:hypothetical protein
MYIIKFEIPESARKSSVELCFVFPPDEIVDSIAMFDSCLNGSHIPDVIFLQVNHIQAYDTINTVIPRSPLTFNGKAQVMSRYGMTTCVPCLASLLTRYFPRNPVAPKTVATCPEFDDLLSVFHIRAIPSSRTFPYNWFSSPLQC